MNRIEIKNSAGLALQLASGQGITVEQASGWLNDESLPGAFSYPISAPLTEPNERFLQYGYRPSAASPNMQVEVNVRLEGVLYRRAIFSYRINESKIDGYLKIDAGEAWSSLSNKALGSVLPGQVAIGETPNQLKPRLKQIAQLPVGTFPFTFFPIYNELQLEPEFDQGKLASLARSNYLNNWNRFDFEVDTLGRTGQLISPQFYTWWLMEQVLAAAGYKLAGDFFTQEEVRRRVIFNLTAIDVRTGIAGLGPHQVQPRYHLPEITVADFLKALKTRYGLVYSFNANEKICTVRRFADVFKNKPTAQDWRSFQLPKYGIEEPSLAGYTIEEFIDSSDELYKIPDAKGNLLPGVPKQFTIGKGGQKITLPIGTTNVTYLKTPYNEQARWMVPIVRQPGNILDTSYQASDRFATNGNLKNSVGFRELTYRGMVADSAGSLYPLGTPDVRNGRQEVVGSLATALSGKYGGWSNGLKQYYFFLDNTRKVTTDALLPAQQLASLRLHEPLLLQFDQQPTGLLPVKVQAEAPGPSGLLKVRAELQTIPSASALKADVYPDPIWVEWIQTITPASGYENIRVNNVDGVQKRTTIIVKFWKERAKLTPVNAQSLLLNVRKKMTFGNNTGTNYETIIPYRGNGISTILESDIALERILITTGGATPENFGIVFNLEPSEEYNII